MEYIEARGLHIKLMKTVYKPREDTFMIIDAFHEQEEIKGEFVEIGSGTGIIVLSVIDDWADYHLAVDINHDAALCTLTNARLNGDHNLQVICGDLVSAFRKESVPSTILFNPPYLPQDPEVDPHSPSYELQQLVGGNRGYETAERLLQNLKPGEHCVYLVISSLATNPVEFAELQKEWRSGVVRSENMGFETVWLMRFE